MTQPQAHRSSFYEYYEKHEQAFSIVFFILGFIFDMIMLERIDSPLVIGQQGLYLLIIMAVLMQMFFEQASPPRDPQNMFFLRRWFHDYRTAVIHFFIGTLLNGYTLFFFKSSSLVVSCVFMIFMILLLLVNESHRFKKSDLAFKFGILSLCFFCYFAYVIPIAAASIGTLVFLLSMFVGCLPLVMLTWWIQIYRVQLFDRAKRQILIPMSIVLIGFLSLYLVKLIPPVPLSLPFIGVYHSVERVPEGFKLGHERPWWKFWQNGDQDFRAHRSDRIYVFFRVFSPTRFSDQVMMRWYWKDNKLGWVMQDAIPIKIVGGREEGFRGYGMKSNYQPGEWKVQVETTDEREIGRVYFSLDIAPDEPRNFEYVTM